MKPHLLHAALLALGRLAASAFAASAPVVDTFTAYPATINPGEGATLNWNVVGSASRSINPGIGSVAALGTNNVSPSSTTTYTLTATNASGSTIATATVTVVPAPIALIPAFSVQPGLAVEVGEEVFLSATATTYFNRDLLRKARFEWDFGDGYTFKFGAPDASSPDITYSGLAVVHYFMRPGDFTVKLTVSVFSQFDAEGNPTGPASAKASTSTVVHVAGEAPLAGFELLRAPFHSRLAQYINVAIPAAHRGKTTTLLRVSLEGPSGTTVLLPTRNNLAAEERFLLDQRALPAGNYSVVAELLDLTLGRIPGGLWRDKFSKPYAGVPAVGIDENNSFCVNGTPFFPIAPFMTGTDEFAQFIAQAGINMLHTEGYADVHTPATWAAYLQAAATANLRAIGPARTQADYAVPGGDARWSFNHDVDRMAAYIQASRSQPALFAWSWQDEPNLGGRAQQTYGPVLAAWSFIGHREDPQHPTFNLLYGYDWSRYYGTAPLDIDYLASAPLFGGKKWVQDAIPFDVYPLQYRLHPSLDFTDMGPYAAYLDLLDRIATNNHNLVPVFPAVQPCDEKVDDTPAPTADQVYLEAWMNVIHGAKGIIWFPYFDTASIRWTAMKKFATQMATLAPVVLGPPVARTVADNAGVALNRVDTLLREKDGFLYVFAARVTEPDPISTAKYRGVEPVEIVPIFTISGLNGTLRADVLDENRQVEIVDGVFSDRFARNAVHLYRLPMAAVPATYAEWRAANFTGSDLTNDAISGPHADPDGTGLTNYARYAFGLASRGPVANPVALGSINSGGQSYLTLTFPRRETATDLSYKVESSTDLTLWTAVPGLVYAPGSGPITAQDTVALGTAGPRRFLRIKITAP